MSNIRKDLIWLRFSFAALDRVYFSDALLSEGYTVRWMPYRSNKNTFTFGRCDKDYKVIEINRVLADERVPDYVILGTLYHEMLHVVLGDSHDDHDLTFNLAEAQFVHRSKVDSWEEANMDFLLKCENPFKKKIETDT